MPGRHLDSYEAIGFAAPSHPAESDDGKTVIGRAAYRRQQRALKRESKLMATRTAKGWAKIFNSVQKRVNWLGLGDEERERRIRRLPEGTKITIVKRVLDHVLGNVRQGIEIKDGERSKILVPGGR